MTASDILTPRPSASQTAGGAFSASAFAGHDPTGADPTAPTGEDAAGDKFSGNEFAGSAIEGRHFRAALSRFTTGITVVTMLGAAPEPPGPTTSDPTASEPGAQAQTASEPKALEPVAPERGAHEHAAGERAGPFGITVNAFLSLSLEPPLVAVSIDKRARAHATLVRSERFGVSVLAADQADVSDHFAGRPVALNGVPYEEYEGFPVIRGAIAQLVLRTEQQVDVGDHTLFVGRVEALRYADGAPLVYFGSAYRRLPER